MEQVKEFHRRDGFEVASADKMAKSCMVYFEMHLSLRKKIITKAFNGSYSIYKETFCNQVYCLFVWVTGHAGTIIGNEDIDSIRWPGSAWRRLKVIRFFSSL